MIVVGVLLLLTALFVLGEAHRIRRNAVRCHEESLRLLDEAREEHEAALALKARLRGLLQ